MSDDPTPETNREQEVLGLDGLEQYRERARPGRDCRPFRIDTLRGETLIGWMRPYQNETAIAAEPSAFREVER